MRAPVDRGHCEGPELEVGFRYARIGDDVHPQSGAQVVVPAFKEAAATVEHVIHAHDGRGSEGCVAGCSRQMVGRFSANVS